MKILDFIFNLILELKILKQKVYKMIQKIESENDIEKKYLEIPFFSNIFFYVYRLKSKISC